MKAFVVAIVMILGVGLTLIADVILKKSGLFNLKYLLLGFLLYGVIAIPVAIAFKFVQFGVLFLAWVALAVIMGIIVALLYYREPLSIVKIIALILALGALLLSNK